MDAGHEDRWLKGIISKYPHKQHSLLPPNCHYKLKVNFQCKSRVQRKWKKGNQSAFFEKCLLNDVSFHCISTRQGIKEIISEDKISKLQDVTVPYLSIKEQSGGTSYK